MTKRGTKKKTVNERLLLNSAEADVWAKEFVRVHGGDEELMLAWFANAIEVGRTAGESARKSASGEIPITVGFLLPLADSIRASLMTCMPGGCRPK